MHNFTPGPWAVQKAEDCMGRKLDDMVGWVVTAEDHDLWISTGPTWDPEHAEESEANARLIAASRELLEALSMALARLREIEISNDISIPHELREAARAAIAKATGESA